MKPIEINLEKDLSPPLSKVKSTKVSQHKGLVIVITGNGKGKAATSAFGQALRAVSQE